MLFDNRKDTQKILDNFANIELSVHSITIEGNWDSFVKQGYITALHTQIQKYKSSINIIFRNAKVGIIFMFLLRDILKTNGFSRVNIYSDSISIINLMPFLYLKEYELFCNEIKIDSKRFIESIATTPSLSILESKNATESTSETITTALLDSKNIESKTTADSNPQESKPTRDIAESKKLYSKHKTLEYLAYLKSKIPPLKFFELIGRWGHGFYTDTLAFFNFLGMFLYFFFLSISKPSLFRVKSLIFHICEQGFKALPVGLTVALIVGYAITLQGAYQLDSMGVPIMAVDTTAKLALREMGPFILALVIAGRSASSFTAELGSMRLTEELSAMSAMNLNIFHFLIIPRVLALIIVMPLMVFAADGLSLFGGMIAIKFSLNISFEAYLERFYETVSITHFWIGVVKAPVFGAIIGIVGCFRGLECRGDTRSIGRMTTISVVNAIFWIIMANAVFSFIFTRFRM